MTGTEMAVMTAAEMAEAMVLAVKVSVETAAATAAEMVAALVEAKVVMVKTEAVIKGTQVTEMETTAVSRNGRGRQRR